MSGLHTAEAVAQEIETRIGTISIANGYETNIGLKTYRGRVDITDDLVPCAVVIEGEDVIDSQRGTEVKLSQRYALVGYHACSVTDPNDAAHKMLRDFKKAMFRRDAMFDKVVRQVEYVGRTIGKRADSVPIVMAVVEINVIYVEDLANP